MASTYEINNIFDDKGTSALQSSQNKMDFVNSWALMSSEMSPAIILASYLIFVLKIGPNYMKDRKPYQLQNIIPVYNAVQVVFSVYLVYVSGRMLVAHGIISNTCVLDTEEGRLGVAAALHYYLLAKLSELLDTVFFVLRKKTRQISFLHIYHHTLMVIVTWTSLKYEPSIHLIFLIILNSFIHVIMYTYYGLSAIPSFAKYLWWKKYVTSLQLVQFVCVMTHFAIAAAKSECTPSYVLFTAVSMNGFIFLYLFSKFYLNSYTKFNSTKINCNNSEKVKYEKEFGSHNIIEKDANSNGLDTHEVGFNGRDVTNKAYYKAVLKP